MSHIKLYLIVSLITLLTGCTASDSFQKNKIQHYVSFDKNVKDWSLESLAKSHLNKKSAALRYSHITPIIFNHEVLLVGQVPSEKDKKDALKVIQFLPKITTTHNELTVKNNVPFSDRIHDNYITSKIRAKLMLSNHLPIRNMKIITSDNIVYIIGALSSESYKIVLKIIRKIHIDGKIISFINILDKAK
ncbi:MAG: BON domain-containing protein [Endozoicomonadaceae bacterium]|nr:BON domain-containing protein [Endozoicomonadaceae bacterium]